jgi:hypothetical protein
MHHLLLRTRHSVLPTAFLALAAGFPLASATAQSNFAGLEQACQYSGGTVSLDTPTASIANNNNWIVEVCNSQIAAYQRNGTRSWFDTLSGDAVGLCNAPTSFFGALGATRLVDNKILCDDATGRFCVIGMQQDTFNPGAAGLYVAWSDTNYPIPNTCGTSSGGWHRWRTPMPSVPSPGVYQPDFNGMGQTDTHIIYSGVLQPITYPAGPAYTFIRVIEKAHMSAWPGTLPVQDFVSPTPRPPSEFMHAADSWDPGSPLYLASVLDGGSQLRLVSANLTTGVEDQFVLNVAPFVPATGAAPQQGGGFLDAIDGRMQSAVFRDGFLYCCHTTINNVGSGNWRHTIRWYQIAMNGWPNVGTPTIVQSNDIDLGTVGGQGVHAFMPSLAVNSYGAMAVAYARSAASERPSVAWSSRRAYDAINTTTYRGILKNSTATYTSSGGTGGTPNADRWGDWSSIVVDAFYSLDRFLVCGAFAEPGGARTMMGQLCSSALNHWATWIRTAIVQETTGAWFIPYGVGTPGTGNNVPAFTGMVGRARIGQTPSLMISNSAGQATLGVACVSLAASNGLPSPYGPLWVDMAQVSTIGFTLNANNGAIPLPLPVDPAFIGTSLFLQAAIVDGAAANSIATTGGLQLIIGS